MAQSPSGHTLSSKRKKTLPITLYWRPHQQVIRFSQDYSNKMVIYYTMLISSCWGLRSHPEKRISLPFCPHWRVLEQRMSHVHRLDSPVMWEDTEGVDYVFAVMKYSWVFVGRWGDVLYPIWLLKTKFRPLYTHLMCSVIDGGELGRWLRDIRDNHRMVPEGTGATGNKQPGVAIAWNGGGTRGRPSCVPTDSCKPIVQGSADCRRRQSVRLGGERDDRWAQSLHNSFCNCTLLVIESLLISTSESLNLTERHSTSSCKQYGLVVWGPVPAAQPVCRFRNKQTLRVEDILLSVCDVWRPEKDERKRDV